jgi:LppX_LprAFG lipoprotein
MTPKRTRLALTLGGLLIGVGVLAGCGTQQAGSSASAASPSAVAPSAVLPTPSADAFVASVMRTRDLATADLEVTATTDVGGDVRTLTGEGSAAVAQGYASMRWTDASGAVTRELSNGKGLFVQTDVPEGMWTQLPEERATPTGRLADPLRGLGGLADVTKAGAEDLDGSPTTRYTGTLPASPDSLALLGFSDEELVEIGTDWQGADVDVTVWIDAKGRVVGIERTLALPEAAAGPVSAVTMTALSDFTTTIDLEPPPTESVVEAPDSQ